MSRPVIGIAMQTLPASPGVLPACWIMSHRYVNVLRESGGVPWLIPLLPDDPAPLRAIFDRLDGIFLTGGVDVDPVCYGEEKQSYCGTTDPPRDAVELALLRWAMETNKPVLAVCRGIQILNVAFGGTLYQDVAKQVPAALKHDYFLDRLTTGMDSGWVVLCPAAGSDRHLLDGAHRVHAAFQFGNRRPGFGVKVYWTTPR